MMGRNEEGAKMSSDGNKEEEEGDEDVISLCSTDVEQVVPGDKAERNSLKIRPVDAPNVGRNASSHSVPSRPKGRGVRLSHAMSNLIWCSSIFFRRFSPSLPLYFCAFLPASILRVSLLLFASSSAQEPLVHLVSLASSDGGQDFVMEEMNDGGQLDLEYDFYSETCPETETIVRSTMTQITPTRRMSLLRCCASSSMTASLRSHSWISEYALELTLRGR
ncbi:hypothetical protein DVH24_042370 [Malus domestica]|uniref:Uncharacterized protein n=1 Tax=Malus domestica TaxID=3750 RepID=A0A498IXX3_MALDO|nr:hypothetical protein DVH24_042370 [Malus domestica]